MNRKFLLFLMIGTAMMIAVIGKHEPEVKLDYVPWDVRVLESDTSHVFGITLGKTTIQEANKLFASFAVTQLMITKDEANQQKLELLATYKELIMDGVIARLQLTYQLEPKTLNHIYEKVSGTAENKEPLAIYKLSPDIEMQYLNTPVSSIRYIPSIDYGESTIRQLFGQPSEELIVNENQRLWLYPESGLQIKLNTNQADEFIYTSMQ